MTNSANPKTIGIVAFANCNIVDVTGPAGVFGAANQLTEAMCHPVPYDICIYAPEQGPVRTSSGVQIVATRSLLGRAQSIDTFICAGGRGTRSFLANDKAIAGVAAQAAKSTRVASVCTGAFILAAAGLLDGKRATTHWSHAEELAALFPNVTVDPEPIYLLDDGILTSAGVTAGMDMALAMVEADLGRDVALQCARDMVLFMKRPGTQSQFSSHLAAQMSAAGPMRTLQLWMIDNLGAEMDVETLADVAAMSPRTLVRRFKETLGETPARYVTKLRVETASRLLLESQQTVARIAHDCGFGNEERMRRAFHRLMGVSPDAYRHHFSSPHPA